MSGRVVLRKAAGSAPIGISEFLVTCAGGLQPFLIRELHHGAFDVRGESGGVVRCGGDLAAVVRANRLLRTASRVLIPITRTRVTTFDDVYESVRGSKWERIIPGDATFAISATTRNAPLTDHRFLAMRVKDAIVDRQREAAGARASVDRKDPDVPIAVHLDEGGMLAVSLDTSGRPLHERGYRRVGGTAPLRETVAAAIAMVALGDRPTWPRAILDPFCGSGTIAIEAALQLSGAVGAPGERSCAFQRWKWAAAHARGDHPRPEPSRGRPAVRIVASDRDPAIVSAARENARRAGVAAQIEFSVADAADAISAATARRDGVRGTFVIATNPPYGERLKPADLDSAYRVLGESLALGVDRAVVLTGYSEARSAIGVAPAEAWRVFNGSLRTELLSFGAADSARRRGSRGDKRP